MTDEVNGGFYGRITGREEVKPEAEKGAILNARILWTFSAAYRLLRRPEYLETATRAKRTLIDRFYDNEFGGVYWSLDYKGNPLDTKKQIYALGFAIYGLSEYARATGDDEALAYAIRLFETIEEHSFDPVKNGYCEALTREWGEIADMRLSAKDENERKTMNTHLHILEPYTNLFRMWKDTRLERQLRNLIGLFTERILNIKTGHLELFFNDDWVSKYRIVSYGHDIEASWLIHEAALVLGDKDLLEKVEPLVEYIAAAADEDTVGGDALACGEHFPQPLLARIGIAVDAVVVGTFVGVEPHVDALAAVLVACGGVGASVRMLGRTSSASGLIAHLLPAGCGRLRHARPAPRPGPWRRPSGRVREALRARVPDR